MRIKNGNYRPEFNTNRTIKQYIKTRLNDINNNKNILNNNKNDILLKYKKKKNKNSFYKKISNSNKKLLISEPNNGKKHFQYSTMFNTFNIFNIGNYNTNFYRECHSYSDKKHHNNNIIFSGLINNYSSNNLHNSINGIHNTRHLLLNTKIHSINHIKNINKGNIINAIFYFNNNKNHLPIIEGNEIYSAIKNLGKYKINEKGWSIKDIKSLSKGKLTINNNESLINKNENENIKNDTNNEKNEKKKHQKTNKIKLFKQKIMSLRKLENDKEEKITVNKTQMNKRNMIDKKLVKSTKNVKSKMSPIIRRIFNNDKKHNMKKSETSLRIYSPIKYIYKTHNVSINNNITKIIWGYTNKGKYCFEYENQINNKYLNNNSHK
jgi:hypothetical protein